YLAAAGYFGLEPERWLVEKGIEEELGQDLVRLRVPTFRHEADFALSAFGRPFDFLLAQSIFSHTPRRDIGTCLDEASKVMHRDSLFVATYMKGPLAYAGD